MSGQGLLACIPGVAGGTVRESAALRVDGDVVGGALLSCDGDVEITGHVIDSRVEAAGSVTVHGAVSGDGQEKNLVSAGGDLFARRVERAGARAGGDLVVAEGVLHGSAETEGRFIARDGAVVLDSRVLAGRGADCWSLEGSTVMVGVPPAGRSRISPVLDVLERADKKRAMSERDVSFCLAQLARMDGRSPRAARLRERLREQKFAALALWREAGEARLQLAGLEGEFPLDTSAEVVVRGVATPGTVLVVGWAALELDEEAKSTVFWAERTKEGWRVDARPA